jgi:hypothetical protein
MVWIYDDPPFTKRELLAYKDLRKKLKDKKFVDVLIKVISLYIYLKRRHPSSIKDIRESAYYDKKKQHPIFDEKQARKLLRALNQKGGGDSKYPYTDTLVKGVLRDYTPSIIGAPVGTVYGAVTGTVDTLKNNIPFSDLVLEAVHGATELGVTTANNVGEVIGGPIGAAAVAPFTAVAAGLASILSAGEGDLGGAVAHVANWVPGIGIILNKAIVQSERMAKVLEKHPNVSGVLPYMTELHNKDETLSTEIVPEKGGKRLSTMKHRSGKWLKTLRRRSVKH